MTQRIQGRLVLAVLAALLFGLATTASAELSDIKEKGVAVFAMSGEYPPFSMPDDAGNIIGFDADVARELAKRLGVEAEIEKASFSSIIAGVQAGRYDASVASHARTPERAQAVTFLDMPYYYSGAQLFVPSDSTYTNLDELAAANEAIAVDLGGTNQQWLEDNGYPNVATYSGVQESLIAIQTGRAAAIFTSPVVGNLAVKDQGIDIRPIGDLLFEENAWITLANDQPELKAALDQALADMRADGTLKAISEKWIGADITTPPTE